MGLLSRAGMGPITDAEYARLRQAAPAPQPMPAIPQMPTPQGMGPVSNAELGMLQQQAPPQWPPMQMPSMGGMGPISNADMQRLRALRGY